MLFSSDENLFLPLAEKDPLPSFSEWISWIYNSRSHHQSSDHNQSNVSLFSLLQYPFNNSKYQLNNHESYICSPEDSKTQQENSPPPIKQDKIEVLENNKEEKEDELYSNMELDSGLIHFYSITEEEVEDGYSIFSSDDMEIENNMVLISFEMISKDQAKSRN